MSPTRRSLLVSAAAASVSTLLPVAARASATDAMADALDLGYRSGLLKGLHAVHVTRAGKVVLEQYFSGQDDAWGRPLGHVDFTSATLHDLRSVSKSIVSLLYGIALDRGLVPALDAPLLRSFPEYNDLATDPTRASWTISHAFNMQLGTDWNEALPYSDPSNSEIAMENAPDRLRFVLDRPLVAEPGTRWIYNGGATTLIGEIIARGTGQPLQDFARSALFEPLGITDFEWSGRAPGEVAAASGLRLTAPGLARIGQMMLQGGAWQGAQIVSVHLLSGLTEPQAQAFFGQQYSNQWYLTRQFARSRAEPYLTLSAAGNGGQRLYLIPELDLAVVLFAGSYNRPDDWMTPTLVLQRIVLAHL